MGFSAVASHLIFAIAGITAGAALVVAVFNAEDAVEDAWRADFERRDAIVHTKLEVREVTHDAPTDVLAILVRNTGSTTLDPGGLEVLLDGVLRTQDVTGRTVDEASTSVWAPGEDLTITVGEVSEAPAKLSIVAQNGVSAYWRL